MVDPSSCSSRSAGGALLARASSASASSWFFPGVPSKTSTCRTFGTWGRIFSKSSAYSASV